MPDKTLIPEPIIPKTNSQIIFISHDSEDTALAEAFGTLIQSASGGVLKPFWASDKKGLRGVEYGDEWYSKIMTKLQESDAVVCLLTKQSLNRPWLLYETGVAKGREKVVYGIAINIPLNKTNSGLFAQFQNCNDDEASLTGVMIKLIKEYSPNATPNPDAVKTQVQKFLKQVAHIVKETTKSTPKNDRLDVAEEGLNLNPSLPTNLKLSNKNNKLKFF